MLRRLAAISAALAFLIAATRVETARRPRYGGVLRVELAAAVRPLDATPVSTSAGELNAKDELNALIQGRKAAGGTPTYVAPFTMAEWEPGKHATLMANQNASGGRPFVDAVQIQMGRAARDSLLDLELGRADLAKIPVEQARRAADSGVRVSLSQPDELLAMIFLAGRAATEDARVREALAAAIERASIVNFILQKNGEAAGGLLPQWSSGTAFLFPTAANPGRAKELWAQIPGAPKLVLGYDSSDPLEQSVAERIVVNAREAAISVTAQAMSAGGPIAAGADTILIRLRMPSPAPRAALMNFLAAFGPAANVDASSLADPASPQEIYDRERAIVSTYRVVPLVWLPQVYGLSARVRNWKAPGPGEPWPLADVWLDTQSEGAQKETQ